MASYPETPKPIASTLKPYQRVSDFLTIRSGSPDTGVITTRAARLWPLYSNQLIYGWRKLHSDWQPLIDFFYARRGGSAIFTFSDFEGWNATPIGAQWPQRFIAVGDGTTLFFDLPMKSSSSYHLLRDGTDDAANEYAGGGSPPAGKWKFIAGAGSDGRDQLQFGTAPTSGQLLEWKAVGRLTVWAVFQSDRLAEPILSSGVMSIVMPGISEVMR